MASKRKVLGQKRRRPKTAMAKNADSQKRRFKNVISRDSNFSDQTPIYLNFTFTLKYQLSRLISDFA